MIQVLAALVPFVPLLQTALWVALIAVLIAWFNRPLRSLLAALRQRIETGSAVKAGWFELSELKAQPPEQQRERARLELAEAADVPASAAAASTKVLPLRKPEQLLLVEDLALRALQADLGVPLNRQISAGPGAEFDGAFAQDGKLTVIEVKSFLGSLSPEKIRASLDRIALSLERIHWRNVRVILVLVVQKPEDVYLDKNRVEKVLEGFSMPVEVRTYALSELRKRFGVSDGDA